MSNADLVKKIKAALAVHTELGAEMAQEHPYRVDFAHTVRRLLKEADATGTHPLDMTIRELGQKYGKVSGTKGKAGLSFVVASGPDADKLDRYTARLK